LVALEQLVTQAFVFAQVVFIDLVLAADNALVVGMAASGLYGKDRRKAIVIGIGAATLLRIGFAAFASVLLAMVGLLFAGGILLLWVAWKMWRDMRDTAQAQAAYEGAMGSCAASVAYPTRQRTLGRAIWQIVAADVSMSIDNVLAVAGAAHEHPIVLIFGLSLSVVLMGFAASYIARLLETHRWIGYIGLGIVVFVALGMIYEGGFEAFAAVI
jgi:YjbE family integral membrane protein